MKKIIVATLNWGLGHATRCIPIIEGLLDQSYTPVIASDGAALELLKKEYPSLEVLELPSYAIRYGKYVNRSLLAQVPKVLSAVRAERRVIEHYVSMHQEVVGIISDNRFGARSRSVPSVYLTHQLKVLSGPTTFLTSMLHRSLIKKFDQCWVPDTPSNKFSGNLSRVRSFPISIKYIGILSRFSPTKLPKKNDVLIILSGPEPNRSTIEAAIIDKLSTFNGRVCLVRGVLEPAKLKGNRAGIEIHDFMGSKALEKEINQSDLIVCRSGYSSIMDLAALGKKAFFIPTKGQHEQEYLAKYLQGNNLVTYESEDRFEFNQLEQAANVSGFETTQVHFDTKLLDLFKSK